MSESDEVAGVFDVIDTTNAAHQPVDQAEVSDTAKAEGSESTTETEETKTEKQTTEPEAKETGTTDEGETQQTQTNDETVEPSKTETSETKTETENSEQDFTKWQETLPPPPPEYDGKKPEFNEDGQITNMTPQEYLDYTIAMASEATRKENYSTFVEGRALDIAEQILPDIKTNENVRKMVENTRIASLLSGNQMDTVQAALQVRDLLGISTEKLQAAKTEGANSTKASIEIQQNAALETGSAQKKTTSEGEKISQLQKRVQRGDDTAFVELLNVWEEKGLLK